MGNIVDLVGTIAPAAFLSLGVVVLLLRFWLRHAAREGRSGNAGEAQDASSLRVGVNLERLLEDIGNVDRSSDRPGERRR